MSPPEEFGYYPVYEQLGSAAWRPFTSPNRDGLRKRVALKRLLPHVGRATRISCSRSSARPASRPPQPPEHRADLRLRQSRRHLLHRDGAGARARTSRQLDAAVPGDGRHDAARGQLNIIDQILRRARLRAQPLRRIRRAARHHPSRRLAAERHRLQRRPREADRLRRRQGSRARACRRRSAR